MPLQMYTFADKYNEIMSTLREKPKILAEKIAETVYLHEFLKNSTQSFSNILKIQPKHI